MASWNRTDTAAGVIGKHAKRLAPCRTRISFPPLWKTYYKDSTPSVEHQEAHRNFRQLHKSSDACEVVPITMDRVAASEPLLYSLDEGDLPPPRRDHCGRLRYPPGGVQVPEAVGLPPHVRHHGLPCLPRRLRPRLGHGGSLDPGAHGPGEEGEQRPDLVPAGLRRATGHADARLPPAPLRL